MRIEVDSNKEAQESAPLIRSSGTSNVYALKLLSFQLIPTLGERLAEMIGGFANNIMLARAADPLTLPASVLINTIQSFLITVDSASLIGVANVIGDVKADEDQTNIGKHLRSGYLLATGLGCATIIIINFSAPILLLMRQDDNVVGIVQNYFRAYSLGVLPKLWLEAQKQMVIGVQQKPVSITVLEISNALLTSMIAYLLIFGTDGTPELGATGLGIAEATSAWLCLIGYSIFLNRKTTFKNYNLMCGSWFSKESFGKVCLNGIPVGIQLGVELGTVFGTTAMIGTIDTASLSAQQITLQYVLLIISLLIAIARSAMVCITQANRDNRISAIRPLLKMSNLLGLIVSLTAAAVFFFADEVLISLFLDEKTLHPKQVIHLAKKLLIINAISLTPDAIRYITGFSLVPLGKPVVPMGAGILGLAIIGLPLAYLLTFTFNLGVDGTAIARGVGVLIGAIIVAASASAALVNTENSNSDYSIQANEVDRLQDMSSNNQFIRASQSP